MKYKLITLIMMALFVSGVVKSQNSLIVADGNVSSNYVPIYGMWVDEYIRCQMIYPASMLADMEDQTIESMTFFLSSSGGTWDSAIFIVKIKEVTSASFSAASYMDVTYAQTVFCGHLDGTGSTITVPFSSPFIYEGGNLLVEMSTVHTGVWSACSFLGMSSNGASLQGYNASSVEEATCTMRDFLPKTLFVFEDIDYSLIYNNDSLGSDYRVPVNNFYSYSLSEAIVTQEEIGGAGAIRSIGYYYNGDTPMTEKNNVKIWIQPTAKGQFLSASDIDLIDESTAVQVYSGPMNCRSGWNTFYFDTSYDYNGIGNLMIIIDDNSGGWNGPDYTFMVSQSNGNKSLVWYSDVNNPSPTTTSFSGSRQCYGFRPVMYLGKVEFDADAANDTLSYCGNAPFASGIGANGGLLNWGIMLPSSLLENREFLKSILIYIQPEYPGMYNLKVYSGGDTVPQSLLHSQTIVFTESQSGWQEIVLGNPIPVPSQNLWITFSTTGLSHPMSGCAYTGNTNSDWLSGANGVWHHCTDYGLNYSWMIKAVFNSACPVISTFPYTQGFEEGLGCWTVIDNDDDGFGWIIAADTINNVHSGSHAISSASYDNTDGILFPDNFLISPAFHINSANLGLSYYINAQDSNWTAEHIAVYVSTLNSVSGITATIPVEEYTLASGFNGWAHHTVSLAAYQGQTIYVTFRHFNSSDQFRVNIDDVSIDLYTPPATYTISALTNNTEMGYVIGGGTYSEGEVATLLAIPYDGYDFYSWHDGNTNNPRNVNVNGDAMYIAIFDQSAPPTYTISVTSGNSNMGTVSGGGIYSLGDTVILAATAYNGYHFNQWNDGNTSNPRLLIVTSDASYIAYFAENISYYTVSAVPNDPVMGNVTGSGTYASGSTATLMANAHYGYHFVQWNDGVTEALRSLIVTSDVSFTAIFALNLPTYIINVNTNNPAWGTVIGGGTYTEGSTITITALSNSGYHFVHWQDGDTNAERVITVMADATYTAIFEEDVSYCTVTVLSNDQSRGIVSGGGVYPKGATVTLHAEATVGNYFMQWQDGDTNAVRSIVVNSDITYTAFFFPNPVQSYTISTSANDPTMGIVIGGGTYNEGSVATLNAVAFEGYVFVQWQDGDVSNPRYITVSSDATYVAMFQSSQIIAETDIRQVELYPNPATNQLKIVLSGFVGACSIEVIDINGSILQSFSCNSSAKVIDVNHLSSGSYILRIGNSGKYTIKRLLIK